jgi:cytochrome c oxidase assembly protein subunit 15
MVSVGAITRLNDAGLSMVQWRALMDILPPLNDAAWAHAFELYKNFPEFQQKHFWMSLEDFKSIYFWEWFHRLLGRLLGLAYALPLAFFWWRGMIQPGYKPRLLLLLALGALQGFMGWYMVKSGLVDIPAVSHYRLAAHLGLAFLIFALLLWCALSLRPRHDGPPAPRGLFLHSMLVLIIFVLTMTWGAFTAGLDAGLVYNETFPKMGGSWLPPDIWSRSPAWINLFENHGAVQFVHRWLAISTVLATLSLWAHGIRRRAAFPALHGLALVVFLQMGLGIATLLSKVFLPLAVLHQAGALLTLALLVACLHRFKK